MHQILFHSTFKKIIHSNIRWRIYIILKDSVYICAYIRDLLQIELFF